MGFLCEKYQLISGGINAHEHSTKDEKASAIITRCFLDVLIPFFDYHEMAQIKTHHFSAGSVENDPILREYNVDAIVATLKNPDRLDFVEFINTINSATKLSIEYCWDISADQAKDLNLYQWCQLDDLLASNTMYFGKKVRRLQEIVAKVGRQTIFDFSQRCVRLSEGDIHSDIDKLIEEVQRKTNDLNN